MGPATNFLFSWANNLINNLLCGSRARNCLRVFSLWKGDSGTKTARSWPSCSASWTDCLAIQKKHTSSFSSNNEPTDVTFWKNDIMHKKMHKLLCDITAQNEQLYKGLIRGGCAVYSDVCPFPVPNPPMRICVALHPLLKPIPAPQGCYQCTERKNLGCSLAASDCLCQQGGAPGMASSMPMCFTLAAVSRALEEWKSPTDRAAALNKHLLWSAVIASVQVPKCCTFKPFSPRSLQPTQSCVSIQPQHFAKNICSGRTRRDVCVISPVPGECLCSLPAIYWHAAIRFVSLELSAASLCALTISPRPTQTPSIALWTAGEAVAIQTEPESTSNVHICLPDSTLEAG